MQAQPVAILPPPAQPGTYVLLLRLGAPARLSVGKLGPACLSAGWYAYVGSALGPGGLAARVARHQRQAKRCHWHIDYLLQMAELTAVWWNVAPHRQECTWAQRLLQQGATAPVRRFGASDCRCPAHLLYLGPRPMSAACWSGIVPSGRPDTNSAILDQSRQERCLPKRA